MTEEKQDLENQAKEENQPAPAHDEAGNKPEAAGVDAGDQEEAESKPAHHKKKKHAREAGLQEKLDELTQKNEELNDRYLRLYSEFDNYRKRTLKEKIEMSQTASAEVITDLLKVLDDFDRAVKAFENSENCEAIRQGIVLIYEKFFGILQKRGLVRMDSIGKDFNTDFHEAVTSVPAPSEDLKGKIVDEIEKGYLLNEKVIRFARVVIGQ
jgi:molecular chaperone GrpE